MYKPSPGVVSLFVKVKVSMHERKNVAEGWVTTTSRGFKDLPWAQGLQRGVGVDWNSREGPLEVFYNTFKGVMGLWDVFLIFGCNGSWVFV